MGSSTGLEKLCVLNRLSRGAWVDELQEGFFCTFRSQDMFIFSLDNFNFLMFEENI
jgi:hypothetical protein